MMIDVHVNTLLLLLSINMGCALCASTVSRELGHHEAMRYQRHDRHVKGCGNRCRPGSKRAYKECDGKPHCEVIGCKGCGADGRKGYKCETRKSFWRAIHCVDGGNDRGVLMVNDNIGEAHFTGYDDEDEDILHCVNNRRNAVTRAVWDNLDVSGCTKLAIDAPFEDGMDCPTYVDSMDTCSAAYAALDVLTSICSLGNGFIEELIPGVESANEFYKNI